LNGIRLNRIGLNGIKLNTIRMNGRGMKGIAVRAWGIVKALLKASLSPPQRREAA
jgi:hypothetical protein